MLARASAMCGERRGVLMPGIARLGHHLEDHFVDCGRKRQVGSQAGWGRGCLLQVKLDDFRGALRAFEGKLPGQHFVGDHAEGIDVRTPVERLAAQLLGRHKFQGPHGLPDGGQRWDRLVSLPDRILAIPKSSTFT